MIITGALSRHTCVDVSSKPDILMIIAEKEDFSYRNDINEDNLDLVQPGKTSTIPVWLMVSGCAVLVTPIIYLVYDKFCKAEEGGPLIKNLAKVTFLYPVTDYSLKMYISSLSLHVSVSSHPVSIVWTCLVDCWLLVGVWCPPR